MSKRSKKRTRVGRGATDRNPSPVASWPAGDFFRWNIEAVVICLLLVALVGTIFGRTLGYGFVNYDDSGNISGTYEVTSGVTLHGIAWAFMHSQIGRWTPIAVISRMIDCQVFGLWAGGHHLANIVIHALNAVLLFLALRKLMGATWRSAFVAAVFAVHPLHVEAVAWVSARAELLCGAFFMLALWSYASYARPPHRRLHYAMSLFWFSLGLMSKPSIVPLPLLLLLLDYWPLKRFGTVPLSHLLAEKAPYFLLSAALCVGMCFAPPVIYASDHLPLWIRVQNAFVSYIIYLRQSVWPADLAAYYPFFNRAFSFVEMVTSMAALCLFSLLAIGFRKKHPAILVGWFWFAGMLLPVIGLVQISTYAHAVR